jgi:hypothetical protein
MNKEKIYRVVSELEADLTGHFGSDERYRHIIGPLTYTPGIKDMAEKAGAWWFVDLIGSYQASKVIVPSGTSGEKGRRSRVSEIPFQVWGIERKGPGPSAIAYMKEDSGEPYVIEQAVDTNFPVGIFEVYFIGGTLLLKSEY